MSDFTKGWVVSSAIVGAVIGAAGNGFLSDIYGRKKVIIATALIFAVGSVICAAAPSIGWLIAGRVILGLAVGMVNFVIPLYLSEISPQKVRGHAGFALSAGHYRRHLILIPHQPRLCAERIQLALDAALRPVPGFGSC